MLTSEIIKKKAKELGATVCRIGKVYEESNPQRDPKMILPNAKCIIGFGFAVPKGLYKSMDLNSQYYTYTTIGVKYIDEEMAEIFLLKIGGMIENEGYDACLQKAIPNLRIKGDKTPKCSILMSSFMQKQLKKANPFLTLSLTSVRLQKLVDLVKWDLTAKSSTKNTVLL